MIPPSKTTFLPRIDVTSRPMEGVVPQSVIVDEPMLFSASLAFAETYGGPLTAAALGRMRDFMATRKRLPGLEWTIDTRTHMLMPGQYPAIGGWHCDGVPRVGYNTQPNLPDMRDDVWHIVVHVSTDENGVSSTEYLSEPVSVHVDPDRVWPSVHGQVSPDAQTVMPGDGYVTAFTQPTLHRATPARTRGWRWWMRASMYHQPPRNEIRRQVQVYTSAEGSGW